MTLRRPAQVDSRELLPARAPKVSEALIGATRVLALAVALAKR